MIAGPTTAIDDHLTEGIGVAVLDRPVTGRLTELPLIGHGPIRLLFERDHVNRYERVDLEDNHAGGCVAGFGNVDEIHGRVVETVSELKGEVVDEHRHLDLLAGCKHAAATERKASEQRQEPVWPLRFPA